MVNKASSLTIAPYDLDARRVSFCEPTLPP